MENTSASKEAEKNRIKREDIIAVLASLLKRAPETIEHDILGDGYITKNETPLSLDAGIPDLQLPPGAQLLSGGGAIVIQCANRNQPAVRYALKVPRPSLMEGPRVREEQLLAKHEFKVHAPLSHTNIARVYAVGKFGLQAHAGILMCEPLQMEWIDSAQPLMKYFLSRDKLQWEGVISVLLDCFGAIAYLHDRRTIHWDLKSDNFLVDHLGVARLTDLGNARQRDGFGEKQIAYSTIHNIPPRLRTAGVDETVISSSLRTPIDVGTDGRWDQPFLDLWMFAFELQRIFVGGAATASDEETVASAKYAFLPRVFPNADEDAAYALAAIRLIIQRLLRADHPEAEAFYSSAESARRDLAKLLKPLGGASAIPELTSNPQHIVRLPVEGNIPYTPRIRAFFNSELIKRLARHRQLGAVAHVYPAAVHTRAEHVMGVMQMCVQYLRALYADRSEPLWRIAIEREDVNAMILAGLLHDVGHLSYGHIIEEMTGLMTSLMHEDYVLALLRPDKNHTIEIDAADVTELHELVEMWVEEDDTLAAMLSRIARILRPRFSDAVSDPESQLTRIGSESLKFELLHSIIDGPVDADKMDYLHRDAHHLNVRYASGIDVDRFFQAVRPILSLPHENRRSTSPGLPLDEELKPHACIGFSDKGMASVDSMFVARYNMFSTVYWHHRVRELTAMLQFVIQELLFSGGDDAQRMLNEIIREFRNRQDEDAITWLAERIIGVGSLDAEWPMTQKLLLRIIDGIQSGGKIYRVAFELLYDPVDADAKYSAKRFESVWHSVQRPTSAYDYALRWRTVRRNIAARLSRLLNGKRRAEFEIEFAVGDILVDIPPARKDQIENVFIVGTRRFRTAQGSSPIANASREAFRYWVRQLRVFMSDEGWKQCEAAGVVDHVWDAIWSVIVEVGENEDEQRWLFH